MVTVCKTIAGLVLPVIAVWVSFRYRRVFLRDGGLVGWLRLLCALVCLALLAFGSWAAFYAISISPEWARLQIYTVLPIAIVTMYLYQIFRFKNLARQWKRSPLFIMAMLPPILGFILMILVWWHDTGRREYLESKAKFDAAWKPGK
jgi:hypothetical protein